MEKNMKFTIGATQQKKMLELNFDIKDAYILTYLKDLIGGNSKLISKVVHNEIYYWIDHKSLLDYLPILKITNTKALSRRFSKYEKLGFIKRHTHRPFNKMTGGFEGAYTFISLTSTFSSLFEIDQIGVDEDSLELAIKEMGLSNEKENIHHGNSKVPMVDPLENKNSHHEDSKVLTIEGTQKSSQYTPNNNTPNNNTSKIMIHEGLDLFDKLFNEEFGIPFHYKNQKSVKRLLKQHHNNHSDVISYLRETYKNIKENNEVKNIGALFTEKIASRKRQVNSKPKSSEEKEKRLRYLKEKEKESKNQESELRRKEELKEQLYNQHYLHSSIDNQNKIEQQVYQKYLKAAGVKNSIYSMEKSFILAKASLIKDYLLEKYSF